MKAFFYTTVTLFLVLVLLTPIYFELSNANFILKSKVGMKVKHNGNRVRVNDYNLLTKSLYLSDCTIVKLEEFNTLENEN